ncbi:MAG: response regulator transcription factor [Thermoleophilia bacterium]|nr:response regulator transcription factor [Thermoleophilia bacterium]
MLALCYGCVNCPYGVWGEPVADNEQKRILLVEDDATISDLLAYNLRRAGYEVLQEHNGRAGLDTALKHPVDLVLMDLMLPGLDGMTASKEISRRKPDLPIIMLTARSERETMLEGFESGADDYITKPFDLDVLLARIQARLRRAPAGGQALESGPVDTGTLILDRDAHVIKAAGGEAPLNPKEYDLIELLLSRPGHLFPREEIVERVWHQRYTPASRTLDVHIRHLRAKLELIGAETSIQTVRGVGYRLGPD